MLSPPDRKSTSLAPATREGLIYALSQAVTNLADTLRKVSSQSSTETVPQSFRDTFACHLYFLYSLMFLLQSNEGDAKVQESPLRQASASAMWTAATAMADCRPTLWPRGVPDESIVLLPCRIAYPLLERATGVLARKGACADEAIGILAATCVDSSESILSTITAALMDLMHSHEHLAPLVADLCDAVDQRQKKQEQQGGGGVNRLAVDLMREMGRLDGSETNKASGVKNVAPFLPLMAVRQPQLFLQHLPHILPHLQSESYALRSAVVQALAHLLEYLGTKEAAATLPATGEPAPSQDETVASAESSHHPQYPPPTTLSNHKTRTSLLNILTERVCDVSSFTRAAVLKAWISLVVSGALPKDRLLPVTKMAIDRLQDKTVVVRKQAMHVRTRIE